MRRRVKSVASGSSSAANSSSTTDFSEKWSDVEEDKSAVRRALLFKKKVDDAAAACARGDFTYALRMYEEAIRLDPTNHVLFTNRSAIYCKLTRFKEALADAEKSYALNPAWTKALYRKGYALKSMGDHVTALMAYATGLAQDGKNWQLLAGLVECVLESDMKDRFGEVYEELKSLDLDQSPFVVVSVVGQELLNRGHTREAIGILESALRIGSTSLKLRQSVLSALSTAYYNDRDWDKAEKFMQEDLSIALSLGDLRSEARAQGNLGMLALATNNLDKAMAHYQRQLKIFQQTDNDSKVQVQQIASCLSTIGQIYRRQFRYHDCLSSHQQCLDLLQHYHHRREDPLLDPDFLLQLLLCQQYGYIGETYLACNRLEEADRYFLDHLDQARAIGSIMEEIKALSELGSLNQARRSHRSESADIDIVDHQRAALDYYTSALNLAQSHHRSEESVDDDRKYRSAEASICLCICAVHESMGKFALAKKWADRSLAIALIAADRYSEAKACGHLATLELKMSKNLNNKNGGNARKLFERQLEMAKELGDLVLMMNANRGIGICICNSTIDNNDDQSGGISEALKYHENELDLARKLGDFASQSTARGYLGSVYGKLGNRQMAEENFHQQLLLAQQEQQQNWKLELIALKNLAFHYSEESMISSDDQYCSESISSDQQNPALEYLGKYLMLAQENNDLDAEKTACSKLGRVHYRLGRYRESARYFDQALCSAKDQRDHWTMAAAYRDLGDVKLALREYEEALECQKYFLALAHILQETDWKLRALSNIARILRLQSSAAGGGEKNGGLAAARLVLEKRLALAKITKRKKEEARTYGELAELYEVSSGRKRGEEKATALYLQELAMYQDLEDLEGQFEAYGRIAEHYRRNGRVQEALGAFEKQLDANRQLGGQNHNHQSTSRKKEADIYKRMGEMCAKVNVPAQQSKRHPDGSSALVDQSSALVGQSSALIDQSSALMDQSSTLMDQSSTLIVDQSSALMAHARCLLAAGDDAGALRVLNQVLAILDVRRSLSSITHHQQQIGLLYLDRGWCLYRLGNPAESKRSFESALAYMDQGVMVVDAGAKCDCYRALIGLGIKLGSAEAAVRYAERRLAFVRQLDGGGSVEEPRALCDLAYALWKDGGKTEEKQKAEEAAREAIRLLQGSEEDSVSRRMLGLRSRVLLAIMAAEGPPGDDQGREQEQEEAWSEAERFSREQEQQPFLAVVLALRASALLPSSTTSAGIIIDRAIEAIEGPCYDPRISAYIRLLSALRYWSASNFTECKQEFATALVMLENFTPEQRAPSPTPILDDFLFTDCNQLCLILNLLFFASRKMEEEALAIAEKLRFGHLQRYFRANGIPFGGSSNPPLDTTAHWLKQQLGDLKKAVLYFLQVEDMFFSWILSAGFLMSTTHRIQDDPDKSRTHHQIAPTLGTLRLHWPFNDSSLTQFVKTLVFQSCFNNNHRSSIPNIATISRPSEVINQSIKTAVSHDSDNLSPIMVGCGGDGSSIIDIDDHSDQRPITIVPVHRLTFLPSPMHFGSTTNPDGNYQSAVIDYRSSLSLSSDPIDNREDPASGLIVNAMISGRIDNDDDQRFGIDFGGKFEFVDSIKTPKKSILLSKLANNRHLDWLHLEVDTMICSTKENGKSCVLLNQEGDQEEEEEKLLNSDEILGLKLDMSVVVIHVHHNPNYCSWSGLSDWAWAFILSGVRNVILASNTPKAVFQRFYSSLQLIRSSGGIGSVPVAIQNAINQQEAEVVVFQGSSGVQFKWGSSGHLTTMISSSSSKREPSDTAKALRMLFGTPDDCREAFRVILHLIEKALQRINANLTKPMFTSEQSVRNKAGPEVAGCIEFLVAVGFRKGGALVKGAQQQMTANDPLYFPLHDNNGSMARASDLVQAILGLPQSALFALSKFLSVLDEENGPFLEVLRLVETLGRELGSSSGGVCLEWKVDRSLWRVVGVPELLASMGFDKMGVESLDDGGGVLVKTIRMELTRKKVAFAIIALKALFEGTFPEQCCPELPGSLTRNSSAGPGAIGKQRPSAAAAAGFRRPPDRAFVFLDSAAAADLSGFESDYCSAAAAADPSLMSVVSAAGDVGGIGGRKLKSGGGGWKRGKGHTTGAGGVGGYQSEGEVVGCRGSRTSGAYIGPNEPQQPPGGYCSEDDHRRARARVRSASTTTEPEEYHQAALEVSNTAQVISVDEDGDENIGAAMVQNGMGQNGAVQNGTVHHQHHEYARLETPAPSLSQIFVSSPEDSPPIAPRRPPPPPYEALVFPHHQSSPSSSCQDLNAPSEIRKTMQRMTMSRRSTTAHTSPKWCGDPLVQIQGGSTAKMPPPPPYRREAARMAENCGGGPNGGIRRYC